jgi:hypothetical protein
MSGFPLLWEVKRTQPRGTHFEIKVDGIVRTHRDVRGTAIEATRFLQQPAPGAKIDITDLRDGSVIPHDRST